MDQMEEDESQWRLKKSSDTIKALAAMTAHKRLMPGNNCSFIRSSKQKDGKYLDRVKLWSELPQ